MSRLTTTAANSCVFSNTDPSHLTSNLSLCCNHIKEQSIIITKSEVCGIKSHTKISIKYETINKQMKTHIQYTAPPLLSIISVIVICKKRGTTTKETKIYYLQSTLSENQ